jgi:kinetochore protein Spc7/SPC105
MNPKAPEDIFSSSPLSGSSPVKDNCNNDSDSDNMGDATMELDEPTAQSIGSGESGNSTSSSARLDAALHQATMHAGTQFQNTSMEEDDGDATMDIAVDEVTHAFKPWVQKNRRDSVATRRMTGSQDQENIDPFNLVKKGKEDGDITKEVSMDITRAIGGIINDETADNTTKGLSGWKRRHSSIIAPLTESSGSPVRRPASRRSVSRRRSSAEDSVTEDVPMDLTMAVGGIQPRNDSKSIQQESSDTSLGDETMDFTVAIGSIVDSVVPNSIPRSLVNTEVLEDMSMELTENLGKALNSTVVPATPSPSRTKRSPRKSVLPPSVTVERPHTPQKSPLGSKVTSAKRQAIQPSPRRSPRKSVAAELSENTGQIATIEVQTSLEPSAELIPESPVSQNATTTISTPKATHQTLPTIQIKSATKTSLSDSLKLLSTPRKEILPSPALLPPSNTSRQIDLSPKKLATPMKAPTPKRTRAPSRTPSPRKRVKIDVRASPEKFIEEGEPSIISEISEGDKISLQDFLSMTNIRFMDLTTTKRRATGHPGADGMLKGSLTHDEEDLEVSLENNVAAAVAVVPMISMYQHVRVFIST